MLFARCRSGLAAGHGSRSSTQRLDAALLALLAAARLAAGGLDLPQRSMCRGLAFGLMAAALAIDIALRGGLDNARWILDLYWLPPPTDSLRAPRPMALPPVCAVLHLLFFEAAARGLHRMADGHRTRDICSRMSTEASDPTSAAAGTAPDLQRLDEIAYFANAAKNAAWYPVSPTEIVTRLYTGQLIAVDPRDASVAPHLILGGEWELAVSQHFRALIRPGDVVFDIGANFGYFGLIAATENGGGALHFFEANPALLPLLEKTLLLNRLEERAQLVNRAIAARSGQRLKLHRFRHLMGGSSLTGRRRGSALYPSVRAASVRTLSIDAYCGSLADDRCDVVKIDIERFEEQALLGMTRTLTRNPGLRVVMEYTFGAYSERFWDFLQQWFSRVELLDDTGQLTAVRSEADLKVHPEIDPAAGWVTLSLQR